MPWWSRRLASSCSLWLADYLRIEMASSHYCIFMCVCVCVLLFLIIITRDQIALLPFHPTPAISGHLSWRKRNCSHVKDWMLNLFQKHSCRLQQTKCWMNAINSKMSNVLTALNHQSRRFRWVPPQESASLLFLISPDLYLIRLISIFQPRWKDWDLPF